MDYDGTMIVVSHDREFLSGLTNRTVEFRDRQLFDHIGDVNAFLEKRALNNMREVELSGKNGSAKANQKRELGFEERKKLQRAVQTAERNVEKLEEDIALLQEKMASADFYNNPESSKVIEMLRKKKEALEEAMLAWEEAQLELEAAE